MLSRIAYIVSVVVLCYSSFFFYPRWQHGGTEAAISWDVSGYYWYLPAAFIYNDIKHISFKDSILSKYGPTNNELQQAMQVDNGNYVMKYSSGMAIMYLPFFTAAHLVAGSLGYPRDGFSAPYQLAIQIGGLLISLLGLWYLRKLLLLFYDDRVVAITLFLMACGTNYLNYAAIDCGMSHTWLFTVYVFLLLNTHYFYQGFRWKYTIRVGLLVGLATLTRPTEIISCVIPLLWGMEGISIGAIRRQLTVIITHYQKLLVAVIVAACVICIQFVYWKYVSGHWLVYSYGDQGFYWTRPHVYLYAFNYRCGWLTYCPMMLLAIAGLIPFLAKGKNRMAVLGFCLLSYYLVSAWDIWWYGGRAMVQSYAVLSIPMAALVNYVITRRVLMWVFAVVAAVFFYFNIWIFVQYHGGGLYDGDTMSRAYFWRVVGKWSAPEITKSLLDVPDLYEGTPRNMKLVFKQNFDTCVGPEYVTSTSSADKAILLNKTTTHTPFYRIPYSGKKRGWLRAQATFACSRKEWNVWNMPTMSIRLDNGETYVKENGLRISRLLNDGDRRKISVDMKLPSADYTTATVVIWNQYSDKEIIVDSLKLWEFEE